MPTTLNKVAYIKLIDEDIEWLNRISKQSSLERKHIVDVLRYSISWLYPAQPTSTLNEVENGKLEDMPTEFKKTVDKHFFDLA